jgi:hypothetical protein
MPIVLETPEQVVEQYSKMIWRLTWRCLGMLPTHHGLQPDDVYQEGVVRVLMAFETYRRTNARAATATHPAAPQGPVGPKRRACFTTYAQAAVVNRYGRLVRREWKQRHLVDRKVQIAEAYQEDGPHPHTVVYAEGGEFGAYENVSNGHLPGHLMEVMVDPNTARLQA